MEEFADRYIRGLAEQQLYTQTGCTSDLAGLAVAAIAATIALNADHLAGRPRWRRLQRQEIVPATDSDDPLAVARTAAV